MPTIFQIEERPISADAIITGDDVMETYLRHNVIDRIYDSDDDLDETHTALKDILLGDNGKFAKQVSIKAGENGGIFSFILSEGFRVVYFAKAYKAFVAEVSALPKKITLEAFLGGQIVGIVDDLQELVDDKFGDYVVSCECREIVTFDEFIRYADPDKTYYVGGTVYYE